MPLTATHHLACAHDCRYTPQSNWGQSLSYYQQLERRAASFEEQCEAMGKLIEQAWTSLRAMPPSLPLSRSSTPPSACSSADASACKSDAALCEQGKIRGWGSCNDNTFGLTMLAETAKRWRVWIFLVSVLRFSCAVSAPD